MYRHEELSNAIVFYIRSWHQFQLPANRVKPNVGTVTVSRRGVVNVRLGWHDGVEWAGNEVRYWRVDFFSVVRSLCRSGFFWSIQFETSCWTYASQCLLVLSCVASSSLLKTSIDDRPCLSMLAIMVLVSSSSSGMWCASL